MSLLPTLSAPPDVPLPAAGGHPDDPPGGNPIAGDLLASDPAGLSALSRLVAQLTRAAAAGLRRRTGPLPATRPADLAAAVRADLAGGVLPERGTGAGAVAELTRRYAAGTVDLSDPAAAAHLQAPALTVAVAAEAVAAAFNASVDTWDSGAYAVELERHVVAALAGLVGYDAGATGVFTSGGTASNLQALLLARDLAGLDGRRGVVLCSRVAHFSIAQACAVLGLGADAVRAVPVDDRYRMRLDALSGTLAGLAADEVPVAIVATAGTTDFGSVDPIGGCAELAARYGCRLHVDAAYGGGALFSDRLRPLLSDVDTADTVAVDLHKIGWQPAAASALLVRRGTDFTQRRVAYLNPDDDGAAGYDGLLDRSLATTRRADAFKVAATFLALGRQGLGDLLDACHDLARYAERRITAHPRLAAVSGASLTTVVFRYRAPDGHGNRVNGALRRRLLRSGTALVGRTTVPGHGVCLKLTLLNPAARPADIDELLDAAVTAGDQESAC